MDPKTAPLFVPAYDIGTLETDINKATNYMYSLEDEIRTNSMKEQTPEIAARLRDDGKMIEKLKKEIKILQTLINATNTSM